MYIEKSTQKNGQREISAHRKFQIQIAQQLGLWQCVCVYSSLYVSVCTHRFTYFSIYVYFN